MDKESTDHMIVWTSEEILSQFPGSMLLTSKQILEWIPHRTADSHKYMNGILLAVVGSRSFPGAALLSVRSAARVGAGGVKAMIPSSLWGLLPIAIPEAMPVELPETPEGMIYHIPKILWEESYGKAKALLVGCGMGREKEPVEVVQTILRTQTKAVVIDADGLYALSRMPEENFEGWSDGRWLLTPHGGELQLLIPGLSNEPYARLKEIQEKAIQWKCTILIKGFPAVIVCPDGQIWICPVGSPAATTAGCGDVLAGACAGFMAQGLSPQKAAALGSLCVGSATRLIVTSTGQHSVMASDLIDHLL
jgi:hydroxyethylthiazole kinase-like uncharacterized protein yjeF